jgi:hypothetical protein|tara:strand:+ start:4262 stop:4597 length:336 start_codon:yes stop_codon:yes gene_type:complete
MIGDNLNKMYRPLPDCLTVAKSEIHGLGLFATESIRTGQDLGVAHVKISGFPQEYCRTPLGGFYNHSQEPNCTLVDGYKPNRIMVKHLFAIKDIRKGEEITCTYTLYDMGD